ncbi:ABC transporter permease subunit [Alginatibacterium sediminis]|uniref:ABC transporter permease subunit n=1 Tax=Alginatibacterium sediminis TaxID=2164068 RepID=A0A420E9U6_9ALTE|nr:ABC transporter permease subunit [Alginatibacterium sediminis]RKF17449.1 ABC transporter permease subunit [Alginatibacterium sediminis]
MTQNVSFKSSKSRNFKDKLARYGVSLGGAIVLVALLLIFFYLLYVVLPLFKGADLTPAKSFPLSDNGRTLMLGVEEQNEIGYRFNLDGQLDFYNLSDDGREFEGFKLDKTIVAAAKTIPSHGDVAYATADGEVYVLNAKFETSYPNDKRLITPVIGFPLGEEPLALDMGDSLVKSLAFERDSDTIKIVAIDDGAQARILTFEGEENFISGEIEWTSQQTTVPGIPKQVDQMLLTPDLRSLYMRSGNRLSIYDIRDAEEATLRDVVTINANGANVTDMALMSGASSIMIGNDNGVISQWFDVTENRKRQLREIRQFSVDASVNEISSEYYRKGFAVSAADGSLSVFHTTSNSKLVSEKLSQGKTYNVAFSPRANGLFAMTSDALSFYKVHNEHPEVSWSALWQKVWYEGYPEPQYVWQSTSASDEFEPKLSLVPISFGTIKAAFYAMLFAVPIAIAGAIYTAYFMSGPVRQFVKPTVEIMEALPTVILGFLAGLWLAPLIEDNLPGIIALVILLPISFLLTAWLWTKLPKSIQQKIPDTWSSLILIPVVIMVGLFAFEMSPHLELWLFDGDARLYITNELGIDFDQRNSMVVGIAMGFAVIPTIFSIAEDAIFSVPRHLTNGSLALGATQWQTLTKVVILTASPGIFSAVMMGLGRAVGETMIVLMATGNTPVMDWSIFQGMRTLSANIAVEMPESEVGSSHYRVLFLAAFVLFIFTFIFNTIAEFVRQRLREKYSSL